MFCSEISCSFVPVCLSASSTSFDSSGSVSFSCAGLSEDAEAEAEVSCAEPVSCAGAASLEEVPDEAAAPEVFVSEAVVLAGVSEEPVEAVSDDPFPVAVCEELLPLPSDALSEDDSEALCPLPESEAPEELLPESEAPEELLPEPDVPEEPLPESEAPEEPLPESFPDDAGCDDSAGVGSATDS